MNRIQHKIIKNYKRELRHLFPLFTENEKRFFNDICNTITDYTTECGDFSLDSLIQEIGEPKDIVSRYLLDMDGEALRKSLSRTKFIRLALGLLIVLSLTMGILKIRADYLALLEVRKAYIHQETIEIIDHGEVPPPSDDTAK